VELRKQNRIVIPAKSGILSYAINGLISSVIDSRFILFVHELRFAGIFEKTGLTKNLPLILSSRFSKIISKIQL